MSAIPQRDFGKSGAKVSALGLGGHHLGDAKDEKTAIQIVQEAIDGGITFFDNGVSVTSGLTNFSGPASVAKTLFHAAIASTSPFNQKSPNPAAFFD